MNNIRINSKLINSLSKILFIQTRELVATTGITISTWYYIMQSPSDITIQQLLAIANGLHIPVRKFFSEGIVDIVGRNTDYIVSPYIQCYYDSDSLQIITKSRSDFTWKKASKASGITPVRLKKSLIGTTRTPIKRLLSICNAFNIDLFSILIDPNPEPEKNEDTSQKQSAYMAEGNTHRSIRSDIAELRQQIEQLNHTVNDLVTKYEKLLADQGRQTYSTNVYSENTEYNYPSIASEPKPSE